MPISQMGAGESLVPFFEEPMLFLSALKCYALSVGFKMKPPEKAFSCVKTNSIFAVNLVEMHKEATIDFFLIDESHFSNIYTL